MEHIASIQCDSLEQFKRLLKSLRPSYPVYATETPCKIFVKERRLEIIIYLQISYI